MSSAIGNFAQGVGKTLIGSVGVAAIVVPASISVLSVATLAARGFSNLTGMDLTQEVKRTTPLGVFTNLPTKTLYKWAAGSALFAMAAYKGASCCTWGSKVLAHTSWTLKNVLPIQLAAPTFFGLCK